MRPPAWFSEYRPRLGSYTLHHIREYTGHRQCQGIRPVFLRFSGLIDRLSCGFGGGFIVLCGFDDQSAPVPVGSPAAGGGGLDPPADIAGGLRGVYWHILAPRSAGLAGRPRPAAGSASSLAAGVDAPPSGARRPPTGERLRFGVFWKGQAFSVFATLPGRGVYLAVL